MSQRIYSQITEDFTRRMRNWGQLWCLKTDKPAKKKCSWKKESE